MEGGKKGGRERKREMGSGFLKRPEIMASVRVQAFKEVCSRT